MFYLSNYIIETLMQTTVVVIYIVQLIHVEYYCYIYNLSFKCYIYIQLINES